MNRKTFSGILCAVVAGALVASAAKAEDFDNSGYLRAFEEAAEKTFQQLFSADPERKGLGEIQIKQKARQAAIGFGECHMLAMSVYPKRIQNVAYRTVATGGSYADAKMALETALSKELAAGGTSAETVKEIMRKAIETGRPCIERVKNDL